MRESVQQKTWQNVRIYRNTIEIIHRSFILRFIYLIIFIELIFGVFFYIFVFFFLFADIQHGTNLFDISIFIFFLVLSH